MYQKRIISPLDPSRPFPPDLQWFVITTSHHREYQVSHWLEAQGHATLVPLQSRVKLMDTSRGGRTQARRIFQTPLFPRMVMTGFDVPPNWMKTMDNYHITGVLGWNGTPAPMRRGEPERIRDDSEALRNPALPMHLKDAKTARIVTPGLFCGHIVEITAFNGKRSDIIQNWFGEKRQVEIASDELEAVA